MRRIDIITIFPNVITPYLDSSILGRARMMRRVRIDVHDLRAWTPGKHRKVDDAPYGGGPGMVMQVEPFFRALRDLRALRMRPRIASAPRTRILLTSAKGNPFTQRDAERYAKRYDRLVILCGHYEGVDERVAAYLADEEVSIGPYVLTGGELPALVIADAVIRLLPGVLGNIESPKDESYGSQARGKFPNAESHDSRLTTHDSSLEYPQYTRPADFSPSRGVHWKVPTILLGGNHAAITTWRTAQRRTP